tara:strand:- start:233 stop:1612 length:1380 start_codon:yes stop_codon:yes gene_type:complete
MIRTRFAPSPTGSLHIGGVRTALFSWAFAKKNKGSFILRIEDSDKIRSTQESTQVIIDGLNWLGLTPDEGPYFQSQRKNVYQTFVDKLLKNNLAYWCYTSKEELQELREEQIKNGLKPRYDGRWRPENNPGEKPLNIKPVLRFKNPNIGKVCWNDLVKGSIEIDNKELDDMILLRSDGSPTYNFAVVVDDALMNITHILRGEDHISNTPRQINLYDALNFKIPNFGHLPMILSSDGDRLSKRHGALSVLEYKEEGFIPDALINYLSKLGWSSGDKEIFSINEFLSLFDLKNISKSSSRFDYEKLQWVNSEHISQLDNEKLLDLIKEFKIQDFNEIITKFDMKYAVEILKTRVKKISELKTELENLFFSYPANTELKSKFIHQESNNLLLKFLEKLNKIKWSEDSINNLIKDFVKEEGVKMPQFAMPLRVKIAGTTQTPAIHQLIFLFGKKLVSDRIHQI